MCEVGAAGVREKVGWGAVAGKIHQAGRIGGEWRGEGLEADGPPKQGQCL